MKKIFKYVIGNEIMQLHKGAEFLSFQSQGNDLCLWALVDPENPKETISFRVVGTGHEVNPEWRYIGTSQQDPFVWHLFRT